MNPTRVERSNYTLMVGNSPVQVDFAALITKQTGDPGQSTYLVDPIAVTFHESEFLYRYMLPRITAAAHRELKELLCNALVEDLRDQCHSLYSEL